MSLLTSNLIYAPENTLFHGCKCYIEKHQWYIDYKTLYMRGEDIAHPLIKKLFNLNETKLKENLNQPPLKSNSVSR